MKKHPVDRTLFATQMALVTILFLVNLVGWVFPARASASDFTAQIASGWNLLSLPVVPTDSAVDKVLSQAKDTLTSVWKWDNGKWAVYLPGEAGGGTSYANSKGFSLLTTLNSGEGFWVNSTAPSPITIPGTPQDSALTFANGWNLLGPKSLQTLKVSELTSANSSIISMWKWDNGKWAVYLPSEGSNPGTYANSKGFSVLATINPGEGFWVNVSVSSGSTTTAPSSSTTSTSTTSTIPTTTTTTTPLPASLPATSLTIPTTDDDGAYPVSWTASATSGVTYVLEEATDSTFSTGLSVVYSGLAASANITDRLVGTTYYYRVKATKTDFTDSAWLFGDNGCIIDEKITVAILTDPESDISYLLTNESGDGVVVFQKLNDSGQKVMDKILLKGTAPNSTVLIQLNDNGLPLTAVSGDYQATYSNYTATTVDILIANPDGSTTFYPAVSLGDFVPLAKIGQTSAVGLMKPNGVALQENVLMSATATGTPCIDKDCAVSADNEEEFWTMVSDAWTATKMVSCFTPPPFDLPCVSGVAEGLGKGAIDVAKRIALQAAKDGGMNKLALNIIKVADWSYKSVSVTNVPGVIGMGIGAMKLMSKKASECNGDCLCFSKPWANPQVSPPHGVVGAAGLTVAVNGAGSQVKPFEGKAPIYKWTSDEGGESNEINTSFTFTTGGLHKITLRLTEGCSLLWDETSEYVEVTQALFSASPADGLTPLTVQFNAADSYPPASSTGVTYEWTTTAPGVTLQQNVSSQGVTFENQPGHIEDKYTVTLTVKNTVEEEDGTVTVDADTYSQEITVGGNPVITVSAVGEGTTPVGSGGKVEAFKVAEVGVAQTVFFNIGNEEGLSDLLVESVNEWDPDLVVNSYSTSPIPPKGYGQFSLTWTPTKDHLQLSATVIVKSNDPITPEFAFTVTGGDPCQQTVIYKGREWQKCGSSSYMNWDPANAYCAAATTGGYDDWFLPSIDTLKGLIVCSNGTQVTGGYDWDGSKYVETHPSYCGDGNSASYTFPTIAPAFTSIASGYWSSTTNAGNSNYAWNVDFYNGGVDYSFKAYIKYVRCVRGGQ